MASVERNAHPTYSADLITACHRNIAKEIIQENGLAHGVSTTDQSCSVDARCSAAVLGCFYRRCRCNRKKFQSS
jgi:hypothetical protein